MSQVYFRRMSLQDPPPPPSAPDQVVLSSVVPGDQQLTVNWTAPGDGGSAITSYDIWWRVDNPEGSWSTASVAAGVLTYVIPSLTNGIAYDVRVRAVNAVGNGVFSAIATETPNASTEPDAPVLTITSPSTDQILYSWVHGATNGATVTGWEFERSSGDNFTHMTPSATSFPLTVTDPTFTGRVRAITTTGNSPWSNEETISVL